ncbi:MAG TPA: dodecin family protein, partial [Polyangiales bacterium]|nr:dodecin family protein [Polyangiales bacterium]
MDTHTLASETNAASREIGVSNHVVKVIEVLAESADSWEDAAQMALREASRSLRDIVSIYIKDLQAVVRDGRIAAWRVNAKVSFVVNAESSQTTRDTGGETMRNRHNQDPRWRGENAFPEYEDYGLHAEDRQRYRGRESYEQQSRSGMGGRSGAFNQRLVPRDDTQPYRNNADEDRRGYQNLGYRQEFEGRSRGGYDRDYEDARYGFD